MAQLELFNQKPIKTERRSVVFTKRMLNLIKSASAKDFRSQGDEVLFLIAKGLHHSGHHGKHFDPRNYI
jgi:hypothetical protein